MLEIVDVYDALTDPGRKYRSPLKPFEAISFIRDHFLKEKVKVDPILFVSRFVLISSIIS